MACLLHLVPPFINSLLALLLPLPLPHPLSHSPLPFSLSLILSPLHTLFSFLLNRVYLFWFFLVPFFPLSLFSPLFSPLPLFFSLTSVALSQTLSSSYPSPCPARHCIASVRTTCSRCSPGSRPRSRLSSRRRESRDPRQSSGNLNCPAAMNVRTCRYLVRHIARVSIPIPGTFSGSRRRSRRSWGRSPR